MNRYSSFCEVAGCGL